MEKVFWLMWLADIVGSVGLVGTICLVAMGLGLVFLVIATGFEEPEVYGRAMRVGRWLLIPVVLAVFTPNAKTIQILAVASASEAAASTALGAKGIEALNAVLDKVIDGAKKK